jgi:hypothetical protein
LGQRGSACTTTGAEVSADKLLLQNIQAQQQGSHPQTRQTPSSPALLLEHPIPPCWSAAQWSAVIAACRCHEAYRQLGDMRCEGAGAGWDSLSREDTLTMIHNRWKKESNERRGLRWMLLHMGLSCLLLLLLAQKPEPLEPWSKHSNHGPRYPQVACFRSLSTRFITPDVI